MADGIFGCGDAVGAGTAIACGSGGVGLSDGTRDCSGVGLGLFSGFGVSLASEVAFALPFAVFFGVGDAFFFRVDFFCPAFAFGVGLGDFFAFRKAVVGSGVSLGFGFGLLSSSSDFFAAFAFAIGLGDSSGPADPPVSSLDLCSTRFAFAIGLGDLFGVGDEVRCVVCGFFGDSSCLPSSSLLTCARRRLPTIALSASAVASQRRKRTTAAERNRARGAINSRKRLLANLFEAQSQAGRAAGVIPRAALSRMRSRSRRRIAFNFPPRSRSRQVKYIQVSSTIIDANAR